MLKIVNCRLRMLLKKNNTQLLSLQPFVVSLVTTLLILLFGFQHRLVVAAVEPNPAWPTEQLTGLWEQYDDDTKQLSSLVRIIRLPDGHFEGTVEKIIPGPGEESNPRCTKCEGMLKNQFVLGMRIITNVWRADVLRYDKGEILDPDSGDKYQLRITVLDKGQKLDVRGFRGISLFGRSQIWRRVINNVVGAH